MYFEMKNYWKMKNGLLNKFFSSLLLMLVLLVGCKEEEEVYITINKLNSTVELNQTLKLEAEVSGAGAAGMSKLIKWSSSNAEYITIDENGLAKGLQLTPKTDNVLIKAQLPGGKYATAIMRVIAQNPKPNTLLINVKDFYLRPESADTTITAVIVPIDLTKNYDAKWTIDKPEVAVIKSFSKEEGKLKVVISPKTEGVAKLTVTMGTKQATCTIHVGPLAELSWKERSKIGFIQKTMFPGTTLVLDAYASVKPDDDATLESIQYDWSMEGSGAILKNIHLDAAHKHIQHATVVAGDIPAKLKVFIAVNNSKITAEINIRNRYDVESVEITPAEKEMSSGDSYKPEMRILPGKAQDDWIDLVQWSSSNTSVATVDAKGSIKALASGTADISATVNGKAGTIKLTVKASVDKILLSSGQTMLMAGDITKWNAKILPEVAQDAFNVSWSSADESIALVNDKGEITAVSAGKVMIKALAGGKEATREVTVVDAESNVSVTDGTIKDALYTFGGGNLELMLDTKSGKNYTLAIPLTSVANGTYSFNTGRLTWRHHSNYSLSPVKGTITISNGTGTASYKIVVE